MQTTFIQKSHPFDRSGLAALSDIDTQEWREIFAHLQEEQATFLMEESRFRSVEYQWPRDPLRTWSRVWEYPYAWHHIQQWRSRFDKPERPRVVDLGSGVTFFPSAVAKLGCHVTCADPDAICERDIQRAAGCVRHEPGIVDFRRIKGETLPFGNGEAKAVYCISVLEHIPDFQNTVAEVFRILAPRGLLVLTIDLDLRGDSAISVSQYRELVNILSAKFLFVYPETTVHPLDVLNTCNGPYPIKQRTGWNQSMFTLRQTARAVLGRSRTSSLPTFLTVQGFVMIRRSENFLP